MRVTYLMKHIDVIEFFCGFADMAAAHLYLHRSRYPCLLSLGS